MKYRINLIIYEDYTVCEFLFFFLKGSVRFL